MFVFVDTSALVSVRNEFDPNHTRAKEALSLLNDGDEHLITTNYIIAESVTVISQRVSHEAATLFYEYDRHGMEMIRVTDAMEAEAFEIFKTLTSKNISFVDCTSFAVMRSLGITTAFTFDQHFKKMGFKVLR